jgi:hypothetical protein
MPSGVSTPSPLFAVPALDRVRAHLEADWQLSGEKAAGLRSPQAKRGPGLGLAERTRIADDQNLIAFVHNCATQRFGTITSL